MGFLWWNCYPAQVFMGDVGSLALGGALGTVAILIKQELLLFLVGGLFMIEAFSVMLQVASFRLTGKRIFRMAPLHHHFELVGWKEPQIIIRFWIVAFIFALFSAHDAEAAVTSGMPRAWRERRRGGRAGAIGDRGRGVPRPAGRRGGGRRPQARGRAAARRRWRCARPGVRLELGAHRPETFAGASMVVVSPGVPWELARARGGARGRASR